MNPQSILLNFFPSVYMDKHRCLIKSIDMEKTYAYIKLFNKNMCFMFFVVVVFVLYVLY